jgi:hypothetical protein
MMLNFVKYLMRFKQNGSRWVIRKISARTSHYFVLYRPRVVLRYHLYENQHFDLENSDIEITFIHPDNIDEVLGVFNRQNQIGYQKARLVFLDRLKSENWFGVFANDLETKEIVGYLWAVYQKNGNRIWHDSLPIDQGQAFIANGYIIPEYRKKRIFSNMVRKIIVRLKEMNFGSIYGVIEKRNTLSLYSHYKMANIVARNYLIKFFGHNIFSIIVAEGGVKIYYIPSKEQI